MNTFIRFFVEKSQFSFLLFVGIVILGINALLSMPRSEDPEVQFHYYTVTVIIPGGSPEEIMEQVVKPIEDRFYEMDNIRQIKSTAGNNFAHIGIEYEYTVDREEKYQEVIREVESLKTSVLPEGIKSVDIKKINSNDVNIYQIALQSEEADFSEMEEQATALKNELKKVDGIRAVETWGFPKQEVHVELNLDKINSYGLSIPQIMNVLSRNSYSLPAGSVVTGYTSFNVKTGDTYQSVDEIKKTVVGQLNGQPIQLNQIADIRHGYEEEKHRVRLNDVRSVLITASLKERYNIVSVAEEAEQVIQSFTGKLPPHIRLVKNFDQSISVQERLNHLGRDFLIAIVLVFITLLPLGFRSTLVVMISIPLSLAIGLVFLNYFGFSLNQLSIVGLILALGILVDDSIVVNENIERALRLGIPLRKAIISSTSQIAWAIVGVTTTLIIAFVPILLLPEGTGEFIRSLPMAVVLSVGASLFVSLAFVPFLSSRILKDKRPAEGNIFLRGLNRGIHLSYGKIMAKSLLHPWRTVGIVSLVTLCFLTVLPTMGFSLFPKTDKLQFHIELRTPNNSSLDYTDLKTKEVEAILKQFPQIEYCTSNVGKSNPQIYYNVASKTQEQNYANIFIQLHGHITLEEKATLIDDVRTKLSVVQDTEIHVLEFEQGMGLEAPVAIRIIGPDPDSLRQYSYLVEKLIQSVEGIMYVENFQAIGKTELKVEVNKPKAAMYGIRETDIDHMLRLAIAGIPAGEIQFSSSELKSPVMLTFPKEQSVPDISIFDKIWIPNAYGKAVPLKSIAGVKLEKTPGNITHIDREPYITVKGFAHNGYAYNELNEEVMRKLADHLNLRPGYSWTAAGEKENQDRTFSGFGVVVLLSAFAFFAALILEFRSIKSTFIVLSIIPLGFAGGVMALYIAGYDLSFVSLIGFIALIGIEIKNSILLVDYTNQLRAGGMPLKEAVAKAGEVRFIPILLTTMTAIAGMIPLIVSHSPLYSPLAVVIVGGLVSSLLLSRVLTPVLYLLLPPKIEQKVSDVEKD